MLLVSLDRPFLMTPSVFSKVYLLQYLHIEYISLGTSLFDTVEFVFPNINAFKGATKLLVPIDIVVIDTSKVRQPSS